MLALLALFTFVAPLAASAQRVVIRDAAHPGNLQTTSARAELGGEVSPELDQQDIAWFDTDRSRYVSARFFLPKGTDPALKVPLVVFSPDLGIAIDRYESLLSAWARYGYAVMAVTSTAERVHNPQTLDVDQRRVQRDYAKDEKEWQNRAVDLRFALQEARANADIANALNFERVAVAGHGIGAHSVLLTLGVGELATPAPIVLADGTIAPPQFRAGILLSPPGEGDLNLDRDAWARLRTSVLTIVGGRGRGILRTDIRAGEAIFDRSHAPDLFLLTVPEARHESFARNFGSSTNAKSSRTTEIVEVTSIMYLRAVLQEQSAARQWLLDDRIERLPGYRCRLDKKNVAIHPQLLQAPTEN